MDLDSASKHKSTPQAIIAAQNDNGRRDESAQTFLNLESAKLMLTNALKQQQKIMEDLDSQMSRAEHNFTKYKSSLEDMDRKFRRNLLLQMQLQETLS